MLVFVYSPYHLNLSFPHLVVILTTLETPKNILAFSTQIFRLFLNAPKKSLLNSSHQKKILAKSSYPNKFQELTISNPK